MNFYATQVNTFLTKLKGLIKKISRSSASEIQSHTFTCHRLIVQLIKDDQILDGFNGQRLRLLAYEAILYLVEMLDMRNQSVKNCKKQEEKNKISSYLGEINGTLSEVKELLRQCERQTQLRDGRKSFLSQNNLFTKLDKNLNQYQSRLGNILTQIELSGRQQSLPVAKNQKTEQKQLLPQKQEENDYLIEEMQRIIEKKEKKITELTGLLKQSQTQKLQVQLEFKKYQTESCLKNDELLEQLQELFSQQKKIEFQVQKNVNKALLEAKRHSMSNIKLQKALINEKVHPKHHESSKSDFSSKVIQTVTDQTISSVKKIHHNELAPRRISIEKVSSVKSFRRIGHLEEKELTMTNDKKMEDMIEKSNELYMLMLCQAATIEELF